MAIPAWLTIISWIFISIGLLSAALILADIYLLGYREHVKIMDAVWPLTALYAGPIALAATRTSTTSVMPNTAACWSAVPLGTPPESGGDGLDVGLSVDEHSGDLGVAIAGGGDQRGLLVSGMPVNRRARLDQCPGRCRSWSKSGRAGR